MSETAYTVPDVCPQCEHSPVTEVVYGLIPRISPALAADLRSGRKVLGGCMVPVHAPAYFCRKCQWTMSQEDAHHPMHVARMEILKSRGEGAEEEHDDGR